MIMKSRALTSYKSCSLNSCQGSYAAQGSFMIKEVFRAVQLGDKATKFVLQKHGLVHATYNQKLACNIMTTVSSLPGKKMTV